jgi:hypothetical protein
MKIFKSFFISLNYESYSRPYSKSFDQFMPFFLSRNYGQFFAVFAVVPLLTGSHVFINPCSFSISHVGCQETNTATTSRVFNLHCTKSVSNYTGCGKLTSFFEYEMPYEKES